MYTRVNPYESLSIIVDYVDVMLLVGKCEHLLLMISEQIQAHIKLQVKESATKFLSMYVENNEQNGTLNIANHPFLDSTRIRFDI